MQNRVIQRSGMDAANFMKLENGAQGLIYKQLLPYLNHFQSETTGVTEGHQSRYLGLFKEQNDIDLSIFFGEACTESSRGNSMKLDTFYAIKRNYRHDQISSQLRQSNYLVTFSEHQQKGGKR